MSLRYDPAKKIARDKERARVKGVEYVEPVRPYSTLSRGKKKVRPQSPERTEQQSQGRKDAQLKPVGKRGKRLGPKDRKASEECKRLAFHVCAMHGPECYGRLEAAHRIGRDNMPVRFDQRNLVCLCYYHHQIWSHNNIAAWHEWFDLYRPGLYRQLQIDANHCGREAA